MSRLVRSACYARILKLWRLFHPLVSLTSDESNCKREKGLLWRMFRNWWQIEDFFLGHVRLGTIEVERCQMRYVSSGLEWRCTRVCALEILQCTHPQRESGRSKLLWIHQKRVPKCDWKGNKKIRVVSCHTPTQRRENDWLWTLWKTWWTKSDYGLLVMDTSVEDANTINTIHNTTTQQLKTKVTHPELEKLNNVWRQEWGPHGRKRRREQRSIKKKCISKIYTRNPHRMSCFFVLPSRVEINAPIMFSFELQEMDPKRLDRSDERLTSTKIYSLLLYLDFWTVTKSINGYSGWFPKCPSYPLPQMMYEKCEPMSTRTYQQIRRSK